MTTGDVPNLAAALKRARRAAGFTNAKAFLATVKASGRQVPSYSTYAQWESGKVKARDETLDPIIEYHREKKTWPKDVTDSDLATALLALAEELREARKERTALTTKVERMQAILDVLAPQAMQDAGVPDVPRGSAGSGH